MNTQLIIDFEVTEKSLVQFIEIMKNLNEDMGSEKGFSGAAVYQNSDNPHKFTLVEIWRSRANHETHFEKIETSGEWQNILNMLEVQPKMAYFQKI